ncbi:2-keto-4-pentenoate hydratase [Amycolatopsis bartoniae]|uniref:Putative hydratase/decarboxylase n=1 Tax=Amycolatopsis bartoniae TaxID=941986 RepID=A0A8H9IVX1_9PSEU|nr:fumarylacetoacetate hydrolase family protein [Amycolatopsis bartoniae]MBB2939850.1 2-keto-4-pentenoate hydratase [Amycolatopsis bartoniae]TVT07448.1 2-keto-4-pentenoate hydratase [Amycolatopsis bartoniae]GHF54939.1 putative hydratase/decarboxylase [Amycolatopsis bartoniae]
MSADVHKAAELLATAARTGTPCPPVRDLFADGDLDAAYDVQRLHTERVLAAGHRLVGRKIGLTSPAVQRQLGVDQPDYGALFSDMALDHDGTVAAGRLLQPKVEAEIALILGADLPGPGCSVADVRAATAFLAPALEIVDSRVAGWDITIVDTIADNASSGLFVLGDTREALDAVEPADVEMRLHRGTELVSQGTGRDCLGDPLNAAAWLATTLARRGDPLRAGDIVLTGALGPMVPAAPGDVFTARISGLGDVTISFEGEAA